MGQQPGCQDEVPSFPNGPTRCPVTVPSDGAQHMRMQFGHLPPGDPADASGTDNGLPARRQSHSGVRGNAGGDQRTCTQGGRSRRRRDQVSQPEP